MTGTYVRNAAMSSGPRRSGWRERDLCAVHFSFAPDRRSGSATFTTGTDLMSTTNPLLPFRAEDVPLVPRSVLEAFAALSTDAVVVAEERGGTLVPIWANLAV